MGKFTSFVMNNAGREMSPDQAAAMAAADQAVTVGRTTVAPTTPADQLGQDLLQPAPTSPVQAVEPVPGQVVAPQAEGDITEASTGPQDPFGAALATPEEAQALYEQEIAAQRKPRGLVNTAEGTITLPIKSSTKAIGVMTDAMAKMEHAADQDFGVFQPGKVDTNLAVSALSKLGMTEGKVAKSGAVSNTLLKPKQAFGGAAYVAMLLALDKISSPEEAFEYVGEGEVKKSGTRGSGEIHKIAFFDSVAKEFEKLVNPTPQDTVDPNTGEATGAGYQSQLNELETKALGDAIYRMASQTGILQDNYNGDNPMAMLAKASGTKAGVEKFVLTPKGGNFLRSSPVVNMLAEIAPGTKRNVSLTPVRHGLFVGEGATEQKRRTDVPDDEASPVSDMMLEAMDVIGTTPYVVVDHAMEISSDMLLDMEAKQAALEQDAKLMAAETGGDVEQIMRELGEQEKYQSEFFDIFDTGQKRINKLEKDSIKGAKHKRGIVFKDGKWFDQHDRPYPDFVGAELSRLYAEEIAGGEYEGVHEFAPEARAEDGKKHNAYAKSAVKMNMDKLRSVVNDARNRSGWDQAQDGTWAKNRGSQVFYYGSTIIGNSGRTMVSNTELNWQSNKMARFIVGNPRATQVKIGDNGDPSIAFRYVAARAMLDGADLLTKNALVQRMRDVEKDINPVARELYATMQMPAGSARQAALGKAIKNIRNNPHFDGGSFEATGEWQFIVDAVHEWGRYLDAKDNGRKHFFTRLKAEGDGINNGSSIQGLQFGDKATLERAGVIYDFNADDITFDDEGNPQYKSVTPQGNMRDYTMGRLFTAKTNNPRPGQIDESDLNADLTFFGVDEDMIEELTPVLTRIFNTGDWRKKFIKIPLMTTIYGMPSNAHTQPATDFLNKFGQAVGIELDDFPKYHKAFVQIIANSLTSALNDPLVHQSLLKKQAGWLFNVMDVVPEVTGPNGYTWQAGGEFWIPHEDITPRGSGDNVRYQIDTKFYEQSAEGGGRITLEELEAQLADAQANDAPPKRIKSLEKRIADKKAGKDVLGGGSITARVAKPSAGARKATTEAQVKELKELEEKLKAAKKAGNQKQIDLYEKRIQYKMRDIADWGEMTRNQLAVNGTHNIDSTVAQKTLIEAKKRMGESFWGGQVFDAFIGDVSSFEIMMEEGNKVFLDVNRNFNIIEAEYDAMKNAFKKFDEYMASLPVDTPLDIRDRSDAKYRALSSFITKFGVAGTAASSFRGGHEAFMQALKDSNIEIKQKTKQSKPVIETSHVSPQDLKRLVHWMRSNFLSPADVVVDDEGKLIPKEDQKGVLGLPIDSAFQRNIKRVQKGKDDFFETYRDYLGSVRQFN